MNILKCGDTDKSTAALQEQAAETQKIIVFQQNGSGEKKIAGIRRYAKNHFTLEIVSIDMPLPPVIDDTSEYLQQDIQADLILDFLTHKDLSHDLAVICRDKNIPVVASGKKFRVKGALTPPT
jgi:hypothetical protein